MSASSIGIRLLLAFLVTLGTSGQSLGGMMCATGTCPNSCGMHEKQEAQKEKAHSCCPSDGKEAPEKPQKRSDRCKCQIRSAPDAAAPNISFAAPPAPLVIALSVGPLEITIPAVSTELQPIHLHSGNPPPTVTRHPDLGRAPPAA